MALLTMSEKLYSASWYRVANIKPQLRRHIRIERHNYRGELWHVIHDTINARSYRFGPEAYFIISRLHNEHDLQSIWQQALEQLGDDCPTQDETIQLLGQLHSADLIQADITPDTLELFERQQRKKRQRWKQYIGNPLSLRLRLADPDRLLTFLLPLAKLVFSNVGIILWLAVICWGLTQTIIHWQALTNNIADRVLAPHNLFLMWLLYPIIKGLHELGHGASTRLWGGEVHELGLMFLVFVPIPYVDASASAAFPEKHRRIIIAAAGMMVELFIASLALLVWLNVQPGVIHDAAFAIMLIAGISTLLFNGNPLLRFDGYYIFADAIAVPNLAQRSNRYIRYLIEHYIFGIQNSDSPIEQPTEQKWLLFYGLAAGLYRILITAFIAIFIGSKWLLMGVLIALWGAFNLLIIPTHRLIKTFAKHPELRARRSRAILGVSILFSFITLLLIIPLPQRTVAYGVLWLPEDARIRTSSDCFVKAILSQDGTAVQSGNPLIRCDEPRLNADVATLQAQFREFAARKASLKQTDRVRLEIIKEELKAIKSALALALQQQQGLNITSAVNGHFVLPSGQDLLGAFAKQGETLGYVIENNAAVVRTIIPQRDIGLIQAGTHAVQVRLMEAPLKAISASIKREVPAAVDTLPSPALGSAGGGYIEVDASDPNGLQTTQRVFQLDVILPANTKINSWGSRAIVRFDHGYSPLFSQLYRKLQQLLLRELSV